MALTGSTIASTYLKLLRANSDTMGADATASYIQDSADTDSVLSISTTRVGIGNAAPTALLTAGAITTLVTDGTTAVTPEGVNVHITEASKYAMGIKNADASGDGLLIQAGDASDDFALRVEDYDSANDLLVVQGGGSVGIGTASPDYNLQVEGGSGDVEFGVKKTTEGGGTSTIRIDGNRGATANDCALLRYYNAGTEIARIGANNTNANSADLLFWTGSSGTMAEKMRIDSAGNVGIGVENPATALHLSGAVGATSIIKMSVSDGTAWELGERATAGHFTFRELDGNKDVLTMKSTGYVGIGTDSPSEIFVVQGTSAASQFLIDNNQSSDSIGYRIIRSDSATSLTFNGHTMNGTIGGTWTENSDKRLKENVETIEGALSKVKGLRGVSYTLKDSTDYETDTESKHIGFIAQECEKILPEVVHTADDEKALKSISYGQIVSVLVEAVKELSDKIEVEADYRLKENAISISDGLERLNQLKPYKFNFKTDPDKDVDGFFAHEVSDIVPEAIIGAKEAMKEEKVSYAIEAVEAVEAQEAVYETVTKQRQKVVVSEAEEEVSSTEIVLEDGKYVQKTTTETVTKEVETPQYEEFPLYDEDGEEVGTHTIPVMEDYEEEVLVSEAVEAVDGVDAVDAVSKSVPDYQGIDQSKLVPLLVAAIKELSAKVTALENA
jgi:hypothetical protein